MSSHRYDAVVIGAGHNGLVCAAYLAKAGHRVLVLERRPVVGGAAVSEEVFPGFTFSVLSYVVSLFRPTIIRDLDLPSHGMEVLPLETAFTPHLDGPGLCRWPDAARTRDEIARFSRRDADIYPEFGLTMTKAARFARTIIDEPAPVPSSLDPRELVAMLRLGKSLRGGSAAFLDLQTKLLTLSAVDFLERWFESDALKAPMSVSGIIGTYLGVRSPGTAYVLLHHAFGEVNGKTGHWGHAIGGMGAITQAMAKAAVEYGAEIETEAEVQEILIERDKAVGVMLKDGRVVKGRALAANINLKLLYTQLLAPTALAPDFLKRMRAFKCGSGSFRMNVALSELPSFTALPGRTAQAHHGAGIIIGPSLAYMDRAYRDAKDSGWAREPVIEMVIPSTVDPGLAPPGAHVASLFCQHVAPDLPDGRSWDDVREQVAELMIDTVDRYAPGFAKSVIARQSLSPLDLEREFGLIGGDIFHGALSLNQLFSSRPMLGYADYRGPVRGLYHCGSGAHPGGGVTGAPGHNAAKAILGDLKPLI